jgi:hypothetical protein
VQLLKVIIAASTLPFLAFASSPAYAILAVGDVSIVGYRSDDNDAFSFVVWKDLPGSFNLTFTDNAFNGTTFESNEGTVTWQAPIGGYTAGTTVVWTDPDGPGSTFDFGTVSGSTNAIGLAVAGDQMFVFEGSSVSLANVLFGFDGNGGWINTGTPDSSSSYLPSALNTTNGNLSFSEIDNYDFSESLRSNSSTAETHLQNIGNASNWTLTNDPITISSTDFAVTAIPEPTAFLLGFGLCSVVGFAATGKWILSK